MKHMAVIARYVEIDTDECTAITRFRAGNTELTAEFHYGFPHEELQNPPYKEGSEVEVEFSLVAFPEDISTVPTPLTDAPRELHSPYVGILRTSGETVALECNGLIIRLSVASRELALVDGTQVAIRGYLQAHPVN